MPFEPSSPIKLPSNIHRKVEEGLDFILNHLQEPLFQKGNDKRHRLSARSFQ